MSLIGILNELAKLNGLISRNVLKDNEKLNLLRQTKIDENPVKGRRIFELDKNVNNASSLQATSSQIAEILSSNKPSIKSEIIDEFENVPIINKKNKSFVNSVVIKQELVEINDDKQISKTLQVPVQKNVIVIEKTPNISMKKCTNEEAQKTINNCNEYILNSSTSRAAKIVSPKILGVKVQKVIKKKLILKNHNNPLPSNSSKNCNVLPTCSNDTFSMKIISSKNNKLFSKSSLSFRVDRSKGISEISPATKNEIIYQRKKLPLDNYRLLPIKETPTNILPLRIDRSQDLIKTPITSNFVFKRKKKLTDNSNDIKISNKMDFLPYSPRVVLPNVKFFE